MIKLNKWRNAAKALLLTTISSVAITKQVYSADLVQLPSMNLGDVNFHDGMAKPGKIAMLLSDNYRGQSFNNENGNELPGNNELNVDVMLSQFAFISEKKILGGYYGAEVLLPWVHLKADTSLEGLPNESETGSGDIIFSPFLLQWTDSTLFGKPYSHRLNFLFNAPTGSYDKHKAINTGYNYWRFNPYYAGTLQITPKIATSFRLHYLWSDKNNPIVMFKRERNVFLVTHFNCKYWFAIYWGLLHALNFHVLLKYTSRYPELNKQLGNPKGLSDYSLC